MDPSPAWNWLIVLAWRTCGGMLFQVMMVWGKKEKWHTSARVYIPLVLQSDGMSRCSAGISTKLCMILYIRTVLAFACLCSRDSHFRCTVSALGSRSWELLETNRAALSCTESSWDIWFLLNESHTALAYSMDGLSNFRRNLTGNTKMTHRRKCLWKSNIGKRLRSVRIKTLFPTAMTGYLDRCIPVYVILDCCCKLYYCNNLTMKLHFAEIWLSELLSVFYKFELENMSI